MAETPEVQKTSIHGQIRKWAEVVVLVGAALGVLFAIAKYVVHSEVSDMRSDLSTIKTNVESLETSVGTTNKRIDDLLSKALDRAFPPATAGKEKIRGSLNEMMGIIQLAQSQNVKLDPELLTRYGRQVAELTMESNGTDKAWKTLNSLVDYRTTFNGDRLPLPRHDFIPQPDSPTALFHIREKGGPLFWSWPPGLVPSDQAFIFQRLNDTRRLSGYGHPLVLVSGIRVEINIDEFHLRNVIFENVKIEYDGGPLVMENVYFVNCTFELKPTKPSQLFATEVLAKVPSTFSTS